MASPDRTASVAPARLRARGLARRFGATRALAGVDFAVRAGEIHALVGENGAGKSTLVKILAAELAPHEGEMWLGEAPYAPRSPRQARARGVVMVSQELAVCPHLSVAENVTLGREPRRFGLLDRRAAEAITLRALGELAGAEPPAWLRPEARVGALPVAGRQLVEIARALGGGTEHCRLLILDEPTSALGREDTVRLFGVLRQLRAESVAVLYITHFIEEVMEIADRFTVLRDGVVAGEGEVRATSAAGIVELMAGRRIEEIFVRSAHTPGETLLELADLAGAHKPVRASLGLRRGEVLGIAGLVGAGRTELVRAVFGLDPVRHGRIRVGTWHGPARPAQRLAQGVGLLSEDRQGEGLAANLSVAENLALSRLPCAGPLGLLSRRRLRVLAGRWMAELGIRARSPAQPVGSLSGGNQQKVALARLLHHDVDVLLLDEPTRGIDVASKAQIYALVDRLAQQGKAVLVVSSYLPELLGICDRIGVMHRGELGAIRPVQDWSERTLLEQATGAEA
ncbi:MAG: sugar ABC transporter ATP-binding protein [Deltaproteobacteria bacterium]|nr:sugar ABC transporter ATP-binding protein [Deltaproteobacteria bacterium]